MINPIVQSIAFIGTNVFVGTEGGGVFLSTNNGLTWSERNTGLSNKNIITLAVNGTNIYAGTMDGVFLSTNNGSSWTVTDVSGDDMLVNSIVVSGSNIFAGTWSGIFTSSNNGDTWTKVNSFAGWGDAESLAVSGSNIFAGTEYGVILSINNGNTWSSINTGIPDYFVIDDNNVISLGLNNTYVFAGTYCTGLWRRSLSELGVITGINKTETNSIKIYPNPVRDYLTIDIGKYSEIQDYTMKIVNQLGTTLFETKVNKSLYEINTSNWSVEGVYMVQIYDSNKMLKMSKKIIMQ